MQMIPNAVMQDVATAVLPQTGKGIVSSPATADGGASFADMLQGKQTANAEAAQPAGEGASGNASLRLQNAYGMPVSQTGGAQAGQSTAGTKDQTADGAATSLWPNWPGTSVLMMDQTLQKGAGIGSAAGPLNRALLDLARTGLAADAQQTEETAGAQQGTTPAGMASKPATTPGNTQVAQKDEDQAVSVPVQDPATLVAAQEGLAALLVATAPKAAECAIPLAIPTQVPVQPTVTGVANGAAAGGAVATDQAAAEPTDGAAAPAAPSATGQQVVPVAVQGKAMAQAAAADLKDAKATQQEGSTAQAPVAKTTPEQQTANVATKGPGTDAQALDALLAASPGVQHPDALQKAVAAGAQDPSATTGTLEKEPRLATVSVRQTVAQPEANNPQQDNAQSVQAAPEASPFSERMAAADANGARASQAFHGPYSELRGVAVKTGTTPEATAPDAATSTVSAAPAARFAAFQGSSTGQEGSGDAEKKGHPEQKAQTGDQVATPQGFGLTVEANNETQAVEAKAAHSAKATLHENILSQIKDGVVTHDGKGNGQMSIRLNPGELGELKIQVRMEDNRLRVEVHADNKMVKDLLMSNLDSLRDSLTSKNFTMEGFDVSTGGGFNSPLHEQQGDSQQQAWAKSARSGSYGGEAEETKVNYVTEEVNTLLDVRF